MSVVLASSLLEGLLEVLYALVGLFELPLVALLGVL